MRAARPPAVAGTFYPDDPDDLAREVDGYLAGAEVGLDAEPPKAVIAPHAGYGYSGAVAGSAYAHLCLGREAVRRVVLMGPSHRVPVEGLATPAARGFRTPLGVVPVDREAVERAELLSQVHRDDAAHAREHSLEVQLPFLQRSFGYFSLVPFSVGAASDEEVAEVLDLLWGGPETAIVISSDLSHYHPSEQARRLDAETSEAIEALDPQRLGPDSACGRVPVRGLLRAARRRGLRARTTLLLNSGDVRGSRSEVVGYGSYVFG